MVLISKTFLSAALAVILIPSIAAAADLPAPGSDLPTPRPSTPWQEETPSDWSVTIGAFSYIGPEYEGSNDYDVGGVPIIEVDWKGSVFLSARDGIGVNIWNDRMFTLSTSVGYTFGRDEDVSNDLDGLGDIDGGAVAIVKGQMRLKGFDFTTRYSHQISGENTGYLVDFGLGYSIVSSSGWLIRPGVDASYASKKYTDKFFGVTAAQAANSGLDAFDADAGFKSVGAGVLATYPLDPHWTVISQFKYDRLVGDAADSPVTQDKDQFLVGLGVSHTF